jgi:hypothetical protein
MRDIAKQFELDKLERQREWVLYSTAIEEANREGLAHDADGDANGLLTQDEEDVLRKKIRKGQLKMAKDRAILHAAQAKHAAFQEALMYIRTTTGYNNLQDVVDLFNKYEEEKFEKLGAVSRMVRAPRQCARRPRRALRSIRTAAAAAADAADPSPPPFSPPCAADRH